MTPAEAYKHVVALMPSVEAIYPNTEHAIGIEGGCVKTSYRVDADIDWTGYDRWPPLPPAKPKGYWRLIDQHETVARDDQYWHGGVGEWKSINEIQCRPSAPVRRWITTD